MWSQVGGPSEPRLLTTVPAASVCPSAVGLPARMCSGRLSAALRSPLAGRLFFFWQEKGGRLPEDSVAVTALGGSLF